MLGIHFRMIEDDQKDSSWDNTVVNIVTYVLTIYFLVSSQN